MKKLELETSQGKFVVEEASDKNIGRVLLKHITEQQASEIVPSTHHFTPGENIEHWNLFEDYEYNRLSWSFTSIESLHSLIKSKGYYLFENPNPKPSEYMFYKRKSDGVSWGDSLLQLHNCSDQKTFYNPVIFKVK